MEGLKDLLSILSSGGDSGERTGIDLDAIIKEVGRRERLSQFTAPDRFTRFAGEAHFVKRALQMAREGREGINGKSVFTSSVEVEDADGNVELVVFPNVQEFDGGRLRDLSDKSRGPVIDPAQRALQNKNNLRVPVGRKSDPDFNRKLMETREITSKWAGEFSDFLGKNKGKDF